MSQGHTRSSGGQKVINHHPHTHRFRLHMLALHFVVRVAWEVSVHVEVVETHPPLHLSPLYLAQSLD